MWAALEHDMHRLVYSITVKKSYIANLKEDGRLRGVCPELLGHGGRMQLASYTNDKGVTSTEGWWGLVGDWPVEVRAFSHTN